MDHPDIEDPAHLDLASANARNFIDFLAFDQGDEPSGEVSIANACRAVVLDSTTLARLRVWVVETLRVITEQPDLLVAADPAQCGTPSRPRPLPRAEEQSARDRSTSESSTEPAPLPGERAWALDRIPPLLARADPASGATEEEQRTTAWALVGLVRKYGLRIT